MMTYKEAMQKVKEGKKVKCFEWELGSYLKEGNIYHENVISGKYRKNWYDMCCDWLEVY